MRALMFGASLLTLTACGSTAEAPEGAAMGSSCGGELVERWQGIYSHDEAEATSDPCHELEPLLQPDGRFFVGLSYPPPDERVVSFEFRDDGTFRADAFARGPVQQSYPAACLSTSHGTLTCDQLAEGLDLRGSGEGGIGNVRCSAATGAMGDCDCGWDVHYGDVIFVEGAWATSGAELTLSIDREEGDQTIEVSYCAEQDSLLFSAAIDRLVPGLSSVRLVVAATCSNGQQDRFEVGIDCGGPCSTMCP